MFRLAGLLFAFMGLLMLVGDGPTRVEATHYVDLNRVFLWLWCDDKPGFQGQLFTGIPTDPRPDPHSMACTGDPNTHAFTAYAEYTVGYSAWVYIGIWDWSRGMWVADEYVYRNPGAYGWFSANTDPSWTMFKNDTSHCPSNADFTRCADVYQVFTWYWNGATLVSQDNANGLVLADWDWSGEDCCHFHWSPNWYNRPAETRFYTNPQGRDFVEVSWRAGYYDGMPAGEGTNRLNRLKSWAGALQLEMRRNTDGWDAAEVPFACVGISVYPWWSNIPGFQVTAAQIEEFYPSPWYGQSPCASNEEAQGKSSSEGSWSATLIGDASQATGSWYWTQTFLRRDANQGQSFRLQTEFELNEDTAYPGSDTSFDVVVATQRSETY